MCNNNSLFDKNHLLQTNNTATGAPNSCSYSDIAINRLKRFIEKEQTDNFKEFFFFRDDCFVLWKGNKDRLTEFFFFSFLNLLADCDFKFTMKIGQGHLCFLDLKVSVSGK